MDHAEHLALVRLAVDQHQHARQRRDQAIADAVAAGIHQHVVAEAAGLSPSAVRSIRDGVVGR